MSLFHSALILTSWNLHGETETQNTDREIDNKKGQNLESNKMGEEQRKKKSHRINISNSNGGGGCGITGFIVLGGALAITGLMAAFATNKKKKMGLGLESQGPQEFHHSGSKTKYEEVEATQGQGSRSVLHEDEDSVTTDANACCATYAIPEISMNQINSADLLSSQTLTLEEKRGLKTSNQESPICFHQEIVFSDDLHPGSAVLLHDKGVEEDMDKTESEEDLKSIEINETESVNAITEAEKQDDIDDDDEFNGSVGSSEATRRTSVDSKEEPIWPAELIEEPQKEFKETLATPETDHSKSDDVNLSTEVDTDSSESDSPDCVDDYDYRDMTKEPEFMDKTNLYAADNDHDHDQPSVRVSHPSNLRIWIASMLLLALLLFFLHVFANRTPLSSYSLHGTCVLFP